MPSITAGAANAAAANWAAFNATAAAVVDVELGTGKFADCRTMGRWTIEPYQTKTGTIKVGWIGWQGYGVVDGIENLAIDHVDIYWNGGAACVISTPTANTDISALFFDFNCDADLSTVDDALQEFRMIVYPQKGLPRVYSGVIDTSARSKSRGEHSMFVNANDGGTLAVQKYYADSVNGTPGGTGATDDPVDTIYAARVLLRTGNQCDGGIIKLRAGSYTIPAFAGDPFKNFDRWLVIEPDDGVDREDVHIASAESEHFQGMGVKLTRLHGVTVDPGVNITQAADVSGWVAPALWFDDCERDGGDFDAGGSQASSASYSLGLYHTDNYVHDMNTAFNGAVFIRGNTVRDIGEDVYRDCQGLIAFNDVDRVRQPGDNHSNLIQWQFGFGTDGKIENTVHYMDKAKHVGIVSEGPDGLLLRSLFDVPTHEDLGIVNCDYSYEGNGQLLHSANHVCIWFATLMRNAATEVGGSLIMLKDPPDSADTEISNLSLKCSVVNVMSLGNPGVVPPTLVDEPTIGDTSWADNNHVISGLAPGTGITTGSTVGLLFVNPASENYAPLPGGPLTGRTNGKLVPTDVNGTARLSVDGSIGAIEEGSVPTVPPDLSIGVKHFQEDVPFHAVVANAGDPVVSIDAVETTRLPQGIVVSVIAGVIDISGTPTR